MNKQTISVVIPCYGSEKTIESVVLDTIITLKERNNEFEIILVNDCSYDNVWNKIKELHKKYSNIIGINFTKNFGQHAALMAGYREAKGDVVVSLDDDGQTDPKELWKLIDKLNEGYDIVLAKYPVLKESLFRRFGSLINKKMSEVLVNKPKNVRGSSYTAIRRYVIEDIIKYEKPYPYLAGLMYRVTQNVSEVEVEHYSRKVGKSGYSIKKLVSLIMNGFTAFSVKPLRVATYVGFLTAIVGFIYGIVIIVKKLTNIIFESGYSSIMATLLFIGGIIMILLGLIGEYIGRIYISINNSPQYVIKEKVNK